MMTHSRTMPIVLALLTAAAATAHAAPARPAGPADRAYISFGGTFQVASAGFTSVARPIDFAEPAVVNTAYDVPALAGFDIGGGARITRRLVVGGEVTRVSRSGDATVAALVPHPFQFNQMRAVSGNASGLRRTETSLHLRVAYLVSLGRRWQMTVGGGPSVIALAQDMVGDVAVTQAYPFDTAALARAVSTRRSKTGAGFNVAAEAHRPVARHLALSGALAYSRATISIGVANGNADVTAGGASMSAGLRVQF